MTANDDHLKQDLEKVKRACQALGEHFDSVQIFTTLHGQDAESTEHIEFGIGNNYAIFGQVQMWFTQCQEAFKCELAEDEDENENLV